MRSRLLRALLLALAARAAAQSVVTTEGDLRAAAAAGGAYVLGAHVLLTSPLLVTASFSLSAGDCGPLPAVAVASWAGNTTLPSGLTGASGLCVVDANNTVQHLVVADGGAAELTGIALLNGASPANANGGSVCVGDCGGAGAGGASLSLVNCVLYGSAISGGSNAPGSGGCVNVGQFNTFSATRTVFQHCLGYVNGGAVSVADSIATLSNCLFVGNGFLNGLKGSFGGGVYVVSNAASPLTSALLIATDTTFIGNLGFGGGAVYVDLAVSGGATGGGNIASLSRCLIANNSVGVDGGGLYAVGATVTLSDSSITGNAVLGGGTGGAAGAIGGGGLAVDGVPSAYGLPAIPTTLSLTRCVVRGNTVPPSTKGAGIYAGAGEAGVGNANAVTLDATSVQNNVVEGGAGGGVYVGFLASLSIAGGCDVSGNGALTGGGVAAQGASLLRLTSSSFTSNTASLSGGAVWASSVASFAASASSFSRNAASGPTPHGGAVSLESSPPGSSSTFSGCSFASNSATPTTAASLASPGTSLSYTSVGAYSPYGAGAGGALFVASPGLVAPSLARLRLSGCVFTSNAAAVGGAVAVLDGTATTLPASFPSTSFVSNVAGELGGAGYLSGAGSTSFAGVSFSLNAAPGGGGGALALASASHTLSLGGGVSLTNNSAAVGGAVYLSPAVPFPSVGSTSSRFTMADVTASGNAADSAGGLVYVASASNGTSTLAPPVCSGTCVGTCGAGQGGAGANTAGNYGPCAAGPPASAALSAPATARSGASLPLFATVSDAFGNSLESWPPGLVASVVASSSATTNASSASLPPALAGAAPVLFATGAASFDSLTLTADVGQACEVVVTLSAPPAAASSAVSPGAFDSTLGGVVLSATVTVAPCRPLEAFSPSFRVCVCDAGSAPDAATGVCSPYCVGGEYPVLSPTGDASVCTPCPDNAVCYGPTPPLALASFWHLPGDYSTMYSCYADFCQAETLADVAANLSNCADGSTGLVCGECSPGFSLQGEACKPCDEAASFAAWSAVRASLAVCGITVLFLLVSLPLLLYPLFPEHVEAASALATRLVARAARRYRKRGALLFCCVGFGFGSGSGGRKRTDAAPADANGQPSQQPPRSALSSMTSSSSVARLSASVAPTPAAAAAAAAASPPASPPPAAAARPPTGGALNPSHSLKKPPPPPLDVSFLNTEAGDVRPAAPPPPPLPPPPLAPAAANGHGANGHAATAAAAAATAAQPLPSPHSAPAPAGGGASSPLSPLPPPTTASAARRAARRAALVAEFLLFVTFVAGPIRITVEAVQIVSSFQRTLRVAWPPVFYLLMAKLDVVNANFVTLPKAACATPRAGFYSTFLGITLGVTGLFVFIACVWLAGRAAAARRPARFPPPLVSAFDRSTLSKALMLASLAYAPLAETILAAFSCRRIGDAYWLTADIREQCYTPAHRVYWDLAVFWTVLYPIGIPVAQLALLLYFRVPHTATKLRRTAQLRQLVDFAWQRGVPGQPAVNTSLLTLDNVSDAHLTALYDGLISGELGKALARTGMQPSRPSILSGLDGTIPATNVMVPSPRYNPTQASTPTPRFPPVPARSPYDFDGDAFVPPPPASPMAYALSSGDGRGAFPPAPSPRGGQQAGTVLQRARGTELARLGGLGRSRFTARLLARGTGGGGGGGSNAVALSRRRVASSVSLRDARLATLLTWARRRMHVSHYCWEDVHPEEDVRRDGWEAVESLFAEFYPVRWWWKVFESIVKLSLTSLLLFISPGTASQVVAGCALSFAVFLVYVRATPYAHKTCRRAAYCAYLTIYVFFFLALLIKLNVHMARNNEAFYTSVTGVLVFALVLLPSVFVIGMALTSTHKSFTPRGEGGEALSLVAEGEEQPAQPRD